MIYVCDVADATQCINNVQHWERLRRLCQRGNNNIPIAHVAFRTPESHSPAEDRTRLQGSALSGSRPPRRLATAVQVVEELFNKCSQQIEGDGGDHFERSSPERGTLPEAIEVLNLTIGHPDLGDLVSCLLGLATRNTQVQGLLAETRRADVHPQVIGVSWQAAVQRYNFATSDAAVCEESRSFTHMTRWLFDGLDLPTCIFIAIGVPECEYGNASIQRFEFEKPVPVPKSELREKAALLVMSLFRASLRSLMTANCMQCIHDEILDAVLLEDTPSRRDPWSLRDVVTFEDVLSLQDAESETDTSPPSPVLSTRMTVFAMYWDIRSYVQNELDGKPALRDVVTFTGSTLTGRTIASTCRSYFERTWGSSAVEVLDVIHNVLLSDEGVAEVPLPREHPASPDTYCSLRIELKGTHTYFLISHGKGFPPAALVSIGQQLAWLSTALQSNESHAPKHTECFFASEHSSVDKTAIFNIIPWTNSMQSLPQRYSSTEACWLRLFPSVSMAAGFPIPPRGSTADFGLEIDLPVMKDLCKVFRLACFDGGLVLYGPRHLIWPTRNREMQSNLTAEESKGVSFHVQWHVSVSSDPDKDIDVSAELLRCDNKRTRIPDLETLYNSRHFMGFFESVRINLGTKGCCKDFKNSSLNDYVPGPVVRPQAATIGTSGLGYVTAELHLEAVWPPAAWRNVKQKSYDSILATAENMPVMVYDAEDKLAWMVPMLGVLLQLAQIWINEKTPQTECPYITGTCGGARDVLESYRNLKLHDSLDDEKPYQFKDLVKRIWDDFFECFTQASYHNSKSRNNVYEYNNPKIRGWEMREIVFPPIQMRMREVDRTEWQCSWASLLDELPLFLGKGVGELITPRYASYYCQDSWPIPTGKLHLIASTNCLLSLSEARGAGQSCARLGNECYWHLRPGLELFGPCQHSANQACPKQWQTISRNKVKQSVSVPPNAAVVFGEANSYRSLICHETHSADRASVNSERHCPPGEAIRTNGHVV
ncbi:MAG: hypothetical protein M1828_005730 [Chrysothrix sp. TS-e1954]|nr:MAG: hypothetical protein M1828_005730 [Chrysothrix sp. TS-e1954]